MFQGLVAVNLLLNSTCLNQQSRLVHAQLSNNSSSLVSRFKSSFKKSQKKSPWHLSYMRQSRQNDFLKCKRTPTSCRVSCSWCKQKLHVALICVSVNFLELFLYKRRRVSFRAVLLHNLHTIVCFADHIKKFFSSDEQLDLTTEHRT